MNSRDAGADVAKLVLIAAVARNGVIGSDNSLPWQLPEDLKFFKRRTLGSPVIMGRATYDSIGRLLPGRLNIIVSRNTRLTIAGARVCHSLDAALTLARENCADIGRDDYFVIGGAALYAASLPLAQGLCITFVDAEPDGDVYFPAICWDDWREIERESFAADENHTYGFEIVEYARAETDLF